MTVPAGVGFSLAEQKSQKNLLRAARELSRTPVACAVIPLFPEMQAI